MQNGMSSNYLLSKKIIKKYHTAKKSILKIHSLVTKEIIYGN